MLFNVEEVTTGVRWMWDRIRLCACWTEARVRGEHLEISAMLDRTTTYK